MNMKSFFPVFFSFLLISNSSCYDKKEKLDEQQDLEFEGNVTMQDEREEISLGEGNIYEALQMDNEGLKRIQNALRATGLDTVLAQGGPYTLFAPSDAAFDHFTEAEVGFQAVPDSIGSEELRKILLHHVVQGSFKDAEIATKDELETMYGGSLKVIKVDGKVTVDSASIVFGDFRAENGYIHIIDDVLLPD